MSTPTSRPRKVVPLPTPSRPLEAYAVLVADVIHLPEQLALIRLAVTGACTEVATLKVQPEDVAAFHEPVVAALVRLEEDVRGLADRAMAVGARLSGRPA